MIHFVDLLFTVERLLDEWLQFLCISRCGKERAVAVEVGHEETGFGDVGNSRNMSCAVISTPATIRTTDGRPGRYKRIRHQKNIF